MDGSGPRIAINGFGRIGRIVTRILLSMDRPVDLVAVNDLTPNKVLAHLFKYDSIHGRYPATVKAFDDCLELDGDKLRVLEVPDPGDLPWDELQPDVVIESTGRFTKREALQRHLDAGAKRVLLTAPGESEVTIAPGVNDGDYDHSKHRIVSNASCTTNALAPVLKVLDEAFRVDEALMTTVHAVTGDQRLLDTPHKDLRRARASIVNLIPTATGAARAIGQVLPRLDGKVNGMAIRVPTADVSVVDLVARVQAAPATEGLAQAFRDAAAGPLQGILGVEEEPLVSVDFTSDPRSSIVDVPSLMVQGNLVKVLAWYDNEWGYAHRVAETAHRLAA